MTRQGKILEVVLRGSSDANIAFEDLRGLLLALGFSERVRGSHHIFFQDGVVEIINIQPRGTHAKTYQVKQVRDLILRYGLGRDLE